MHTWIEIDAVALSHNVESFIRLVDKKRFAPVLKSNAYGHGLSEVYSIIQDHQLEWICVNYLSEAQVLRKLGFKNKILIVGPTKREEFEVAAEINAAVFVNSWEHLYSIEALKRKPDLHIKIDTGMSRQGFLADELPTLLDYFKKKKLSPSGLASHFSNVEDVSDSEFASLQLTRLKQAQSAFETQGFHTLNHIASSASTLIMNESRLDLCRVGISLYGLWPSKLTHLSHYKSSSDTIDLKPILSWQTKISQIKKVKKNGFIGYGCSYQANRDMLVAVLPVGYNEGYSRLASQNNAVVLIDDNRCPIVGRICMNMMMVDVSHVANAKIDMQTTLIGQNGSQNISAEEFSSWHETIHYEALTRLHEKIPRIVRNRR
ncbi:MAG: alanine racemase [Oligoflexales bacterium]|nr:alanine racemase [Oligoflexales bacterium]